ncbi:LysR family transcriptional regulator [Angustibacter sp. McL0619]|uniref:LysR family transcriptional regulator n=1 Tax=Angustibacter sp. McL0619 TaxID=3415676 RepID=UPI003CEAB0C4
MELRQLVYLEAVVRCGGFTRAGEELHIAQPAISAQVRRLEKELGVELLRRTTRSVVLTVAGRQFLQHVTAALGLLDRARAEAEGHRTMALGHVRVGTTPITGDLDLVAALAGFRERYPGVRLSLRTGLADPLLDEMRRGSLDVVVAPSHSTDDPYLRVVPVAREQLVLVTPLADDRIVETMADVVDDVFVCLPQNSGLRRLLGAAFAPLGATPRVEFETSTPASIRELVAAGFGSALLAASVVAQPGPAVRVHHLPDLPEHPRICVYSVEHGGPPAARRFVDELVNGSTSRG